MSTCGSKGDGILATKLHIMLTSVEVIAYYFEFYPFFTSPFAYPQDGWQERLKTWQNMILDTMKWGKYWI